MAINEKGAPEMPFPTLIQIYPHLRPAAGLSHIERTPWQNAWICSRFMLGDQTLFRTSTAYTAATLKLTQETLVSLKILTGVQQKKKKKFDQISLGNATVYLPLRDTAHISVSRP